MLSLPRFTVRSGFVKIYFGAGSVGALRGWVKGFRRVFVVTGRSSARVSGALGDIEGILKEVGVEYCVFNGVVPNPTVSIVNELAAEMWRFGSEAAVAVGGGSVIDAAKLASVIVRCGGSAEEYLRRVREPYTSLPLAAVNLTHGTGTEADRYAVATIEETNEKIGLGSECMYPSVSIDNPNYLKTLPREQTMYTALDALYHSIESATSASSSPYTELLAEEAVKLIVKWLPVAVNDLSNLEARYWLLYASMIAGISIDHSRTHLVHAVELALSGLNPKLAHGCGLALIGPHAVELIYRARPEVMCKLLRHMDPTLRPTSEHSGKAAEALRKFQEQVGFKEKLTDYEFTAEHVARVKKLTMRTQEHLVKLAPFKVTDSVVEKIYRAALKD